jgi:hypothetical protein
VPESRRASPSRPTVIAAGVSSPVCVSSRPIALMRSREKPVCSAIARVEWCRHPVASACVKPNSTRRSRISSDDRHACPSHRSRPSSPDGGWLTRPSRVVVVRGSPRPYPPGAAATARRGGPQFRRPSLARTGTAAYRYQAQREEKQRRWSTRWGVPCRFRPGGLPGISKARFSEDKPARRFEACRPTFVT